ncbi:MAG: response regulator [Candidatus Omnitrophica bacterium]|nr:response regulator [Candidatus Omnitrophota bacterium]
MEKILIADDEVDIREIMKSIIAKEGYEVIAVEDGTQALATAREVKPDLVILDYLMPGLNGIEVCRALQKEEETRRIPVIIITAYPNQKDEALNAGAVDFLSKEADNVDIVWRIRSALKVRNVANELQRMIAYINELEKKVPPDSGSA